MHLRRLNENLDRAGIPFCYATSPLCRGEKPARYSQPSAPLAVFAPSRTPSRTPSSTPPLEPRESSRAQHLPVEECDGAIDQATQDRTSADISLDELIADSSSHESIISLTSKATAADPLAPQPSTVVLPQGLQDALNKSGLNIAPDFSLVHKSDLLQRQLDEVVSLVLAYTANTMVADTIDALLSCFGEAIGQPGGGIPRSPRSPRMPRPDAVTTAAAAYAARQRVGANARPVSPRRNSADLLLAKRSMRRMAAAAMERAQQADARRSGIRRDVRSASRAPLARSSHRLSARTNTKEVARRNFVSKSTPYMLGAPSKQRPPVPTQSHLPPIVTHPKPPRLYRKEVAAEPSRFLGSTASLGETLQKPIPTRDVRVDSCVGSSLPMPYSSRPRLLRNLTPPSTSSSTASLSTVSQQGLELPELPSDADDDYRDLAFGGQDRPLTRALSEKIPERCGSRGLPSERTTPYAGPERPVPRTPMERQPFRPEGPSAAPPGPPSYRTKANSFVNIVPSGSPPSSQKVRSRERIADRDKDTPITANAVRRDRCLVDRETSPRRDRPPPEREREKENDGAGPAKRVFDPRRRPHLGSPPGGPSRVQSPRFKPPMPDIVWAASTPQGWAKIRAAKAAAAAAAARQQLASQAAMTEHSRARARLEGQTFTNKAKTGGLADAGRGAKHVHRRRVSLKNRRNHGHRRFSPAADAFPEPSKLALRKDGRSRYFHNKGPESLIKSRSQSRPASRNRSPGPQGQSPSRNRSRPRSPTQRPASRSRGRHAGGEASRRFRPSHATDASADRASGSTTEAAGAAAQQTQSSSGAPGNGQQSNASTLKMRNKKKKKSDDAMIPSTQSVGTTTADNKRSTSPSDAGATSTGATAKTSRGSKGALGTVRRVGNRPPAPAADNASGGVTSPNDDDASVATDDTSTATTTANRDKKPRRPSVSSSTTINTRFSPSSTKVDGGGADGDTRQNLDSDKDDSDAAPPHLPDMPAWHPSVRKGLPIFHCCTTDDIFFDTKNRFIQKKSKDAGDTTQKEEVMENLDAVTGPAEVESWVGVAREARTSASERYRQELHVMMAGLLDTPPAWTRVGSPLPGTQRTGEDSITDTSKSLGLDDLAPQPPEESASSPSEATSASSVGRREIMESSSSSSWASADLCSFADTPAEDNVDSTASRPSTGWSFKGNGLWNSPWKHTRKEVRVTVAWARRCFARGDVQKPPGVVGLSARLGFLLARFIGTLLPSGHDHGLQRPGRELLLAQSCVEHLRAALCNPTGRWRHRGCQGSPHSKRRRQRQRRLRRLQRLRRLATLAGATVASSSIHSSARSSARTSVRSSAGSSLKAPAPPSHVDGIAETESDASLLMDTDERGECGGGDADRGGDGRDGGGDEVENGACDSTASTAELSIATQGKVSESDKDEVDECASTSAIDISMTSDRCYSQVEDSNRIVSDEDEKEKRVCEDSCDEADTSEKLGRENEINEEVDADDCQGGCNEAYLDERAEEVHIKEIHEEDVVMSDKYISDTLDTESNPTCIEVLNLGTDDVKDEAPTEQTRYESDSEGLNTKSDCKDVAEETPDVDRESREESRGECGEADDSPSVEVKVPDDDVDTGKERANEAEENEAVEVVSSLDETSTNEQFVGVKTGLTSDMNLDTKDGTKINGDEVDAVDTADQSDEEFIDEIEADETEYETDENSSEVNISDVVFNIDHHEGERTNDDDLSDTDITYVSDLDASTLEYTPDASEVDETPIDEINLENDGKFAYQSSMKVETGNAGSNFEFSLGQTLQSDITSIRSDESEVYSSMFGSVCSSLHGDATTGGSIYFFTSHTADALGEFSGVCPSSNMNTKENPIGDSLETKDVNIVLAEENEDDDGDSTDWWSQAVQMGSDCEDESSMTINVKTTHQQSPLESHLFCDCSLESLCEIPSKSISEVSPVETSKSTKDRCFSPVVRDVPASPCTDASDTMPKD